MEHQQPSGLVVPSREKTFDVIAAMFGSKSKDEERRKRGASTRPTKYRSFL
jgi:hypothetical protein